jgi:hypothetical protein
LTPVLRGLTQSHAKTDPYAEDGRLRGRTYAIPFDAVWSAALAIAEGGMRGWTVTASNDEAGTIDIEAQTMVLKVKDDITVMVGLDENAQTRVDIHAQARNAKPDLGRNPRKIGAFFKELDRALDPAPGLILDPTTPPEWSDTE